MPFVKDQIPKPPVFKTKIFPLVRCVVIADGSGIALRENQIDPTLHRLHGDVTADLEEKQRVALAQEEVDAAIARAEAKEKEDAETAAAEKAVRDAGEGKKKGK